MKYREKSVVIDAFKWTGDMEQVEDPKWIIDAIEEGKVWFNNIGTPNVTMGIKTLEGNHIANRGDYIIKGVKGEIYPCKEDIFEMTYDLVKNNKDKTIGALEGQKKDLWSLHIYDHMRNEKLCCEFVNMVIDFSRKEGLTLKMIENYMEYVRDSFKSNAVIEPIK